VALIFLIWTQVDSGRQESGRDDRGRCSQLVAALAAIQVGREGWSFAFSGRHHRGSRRDAFLSLSRTSCRLAQRGLESHGHQRLVESVHPEDHDRCAGSPPPIVLLYQGWTYWVFASGSAHGTSPPKRD